MIPLSKRLSKLSSAKSCDMDTLSSLEEQLRNEVAARQRVESQLKGAEVTGRGKVATPTH